jgi:hypothetical protein
MLWVRILRSSTVSVLSIFAFNEFKSILEKYFFDLLGLAFPWKVSLDYVTSYKIK